MENNKITDDIVYIGVDDKTIDLFESQYVVPNGVSYNSYLIKDDKYVVMDTVDSRGTDGWLSNLESALDGHDVDYLVIHHLEPDHSSSIGILCDKYPNMKLVGNAKTFAFLPQFFSINNIQDRMVLVNEGDEISFGKHTLKFIMAPMVHWPEVMFSYDITDKALFSADAFGKFGALDTDEEWACEARRYYFNIVGKYGVQVQAVLKKASNIDIKIICPLHGPILNENLDYYLSLYDTWSSYRAETDGVFIAFASIHGNTAKVAYRLKEILEEKGANKVAISDLAREDFAEAIEDAFRYDKIVLAASSYNAKVFPPMENLLVHLKDKNYQNKKIGIIENGTWAPSAAKTMLEIIDGMKNIEIVEPKITIKTKMKEEDEKLLEELADNILNN
ncbi:MAG: FprA family A-type flavoprotein [Clostridia bacterium]|nr:FprA family A-type flavoprotein [Clostridia bacterium]